MGIAANGWIALATKMIKVYGQTIPMALIKSKDGDNAYDPILLGREPGGIDIYEFYGAPLDFNIKDMDKVTIITGQKMVWCPGTNINDGPLNPQVGDQIKMVDGNGDNIYFRVLEVTSYETESVNCAFLVKIGA